MTPDADDLLALLEELRDYHMPFGKFGPADYPPRGVPLHDLPIEYLSWFEMREYPKGKLGRLMKMVYEIKGAGLDSLFDPLRKERGGRHALPKAKNKPKG